MPESIAIKAKIAAVIDEYSVIINKGSKDGVREGMRFRIYPEGSMQTITDPDNPDKKLKITLYAPEVTAREILDDFSKCYTAREFIFPDTASPLYALTGVKLLYGQEKTLKEKVRPITAGDTVEEVVEPLEIIKAIYGTVNKFIDVTTKLNEQVKNNKLSIKASNNIAGDPDVGVPKRLTINYKINGIGRNTKKGTL